MNKILNIYKLLLGILILISLFLLGIRLNLKVELDRERFINEKIINTENEFEQANKNNFIKLKNDLLSKDIILDNISNKVGGRIEFNIHKDMYFSELNEFIVFLGNISDLDIINFSIQKNNFDYSVVVSAEI